MWIFSNIKEYYTEVSTLYMYIWDPEATAIAGILGSLVSMWKVTTPVGRSIIVFSVTYSSRSIILCNLQY